MDGYITCAEARNNPYVSCNGLQHQFISHSALSVESEKKKWGKTNKKAIIPEAWKDGTKYGRTNAQEESFHEDTVCVSKQNYKQNYTAGVSLTRQEDTFKIILSKTIMTSRGLESRHWLRESCCNPLMSRTGCWLEEPGGGRGSRRVELNRRLTAAERRTCLKFPTTLRLSYSSAPPPIGSFIVHALNQLMEVSRLKRLLMKEQVCKECLP